MRNKGEPIGRRSDSFRQLWLGQKPRKWEKFKKKRSKNLPVEYPPPNPWRLFENSVQKPSKKPRDRNALLAFSFLCSSAWGNEGTGRKLEKTKATKNGSSSSSSLSPFFLSLLLLLRVALRGSCYVVSFRFFFFFSFLFFLFLFLSCVCKTDDAGGDGKKREKNWKTDGGHAGPRYEEVGKRKNKWVKWKNQIEKKTKNKNRRTSYRGVQLSERVLLIER